MEIKSRLPAPTQEEVLDSIQRGIESFRSRDQRIERIKKALNQENQKDGRKKNLLAKIDAKISTTDYKVFFPVKYAANNMFKPANTLFDTFVREIEAEQLSNQEKLELLNELMTYLKDVQEKCNTDISEEDFIYDKKQINYQLDKAEKNINKAKQQLVVKPLRLDLREVVYSENPSI